MSMGSKLAAATPAAMPASTPASGGTLPMSCCTSQAAAPFSRPAGTPSAPPSVPPPSKLPVLKGSARPPSALASPYVGGSDSWRWSTTQQVLNAIQTRVEASESAKAAFDSIDENKSGRVSADELAVALKAMQVSVSEKKAEEIIREINERFGSKRKALTLEIFVQAFKKGASHGGNLVQRL